MKIFLLTQSKISGYDTYDSCVVCAENKDEALKFHPSVYKTSEEYINKTSGMFPSWPLYKDRKYIMCEEIGVANDDQTSGVVCASFNAG